MTPEQRAARLAERDHAWDLLAEMISRDMTRKLKSIREAETVTSTSRPEESGIHHANARMLNNLRDLRDEVTEWITTIEKGQ